MDSNGVGGFTLDCGWSPIARRPVQNDRGAHVNDGAGVIERASCGIVTQDAIHPMTVHLLLEKFDGDFSPRQLWKRRPRRHGRGTKASPYVYDPGEKNPRLKPYEVLEFDYQTHGPLNLLMTQGAGDIWTALSGGTIASGGYYNSTNAALGVGDGAGVQGAGTASFTNGSATVTGSGTSFNTLFSVGDYINLISDGTYYKIQSIGGATSITLTTNWLGTTGSGNYNRIPLEVASATDLAASSNKYRQQVSGAPTLSSNQAVYVASFDGTHGNFFWNEWALFNSGTNQSGNHMFNRKVISLGQKAALSTWQLTSTLSAA